MAHLNSVPEPPRDSKWVNVGQPAALAENGRALVRVAGKSIAVFDAGGTLYACNNRCPHEGFPLLEGSLADNCQLTCNWHNWKFDLATGETLVGGDRLRRYPVERRDGDVWLDVAEPPRQAQVDRARADLLAAMDDNDYARMAREVARLTALDATAPEIVAAAVEHSYDRFEFGTTHAYAAAAEWLDLADRAATPLDAAVPVLEAVAHIARDTLREPTFPYAEAQRAYAADDLVAAIEAEDETAAVALVRGAVAAGLSHRDLQPALAHAALAHYADFGHAAIWVDKTAKLIDQLGLATQLPLLLALVRSLVYATREDLIPEFRAYGPTVAAWDATADEPVSAADFQGASVRQALARAARSAGRVDALYAALTEAAAWNLLHFDADCDTRVDVAYGDNVGWLDYTHGLTFANAARRLCGQYPELWPQALAQLACFVGRNKKHVRADAATAARWHVADPEAFFAAAYDSLQDHGTWRNILACHRLKTLTAVEEEVRHAPDAAYGPVMLAGLNRYLNADLKGKHVLRTMRQAFEFVAAE